MKKGLFEKCPICDNNELKIFYDLYTSKIDFKACFNCNYHKVY